MTDLDPNDAVDLDVIEARPRQIGRRGRRVLAAVVAGALLVGVAVWYADRRGRAGEYEALLDCVARAEPARAAAETRVAAMASYVRPSLTVFDATDRGLYQIIARQAAVAEPDFASAVRHCRDVQVLGLHAAIDRARTSYLTYLTAEEDRLSSIVADGSHAFDDTADIVAMRRTAYSELTAAAPDGSARRRLAALTRVDG